MSTQLQLPYTPQRFQFYIDISAAVGFLAEKRFRFLHVLPTTMARNRMEAVLEHVDSIPEEEHVALLVIKSEKSCHDAVERYIRDFVGKSQSDRFIFVRFSTGYSSGSSGETREAARQIFKEVCEKVDHSDFLIRFSDDRRESRSGTPITTDEAYLQLHRQAFSRKEPTVFGGMPWRTNGKQNPDTATQEIQCCVQTIFMTPRTFLHIMRVCYDDPRNLSAFASPLAQDYAFIQCLLRKEIRIEQTQLFARYTRPCPSISRKKNVTKTYTQEQKQAFALMMSLFLEVQEVQGPHRKTTFVMTFDNGYTVKIARDTEGFEVHWEAFRNWYTGGSLSPSQSPSSVATLALSSPSPTLKRSCPSPVSLENGPAAGKRQRVHTDESIDLS